MILEKINEKLTEKGFHSVTVNVKDFYLYYIVIQREIYIVAVLDCPKGTEFTAEQYKNIRRQIHNNFMNQDHESLRLLSIISTNNVEGVRNLCDDEKDQWFIDTTNDKLIIYENQSGEFLGLRREIENILIDSLTKEKGREDYFNIPPYQETQKTSKISLGARYFTKCNTLLIIINVLVFLITDIKGSTINSNTLLETGALYWPAVVNSGEYYRLITYMFLHSGFEHLANNMLVLLFIGDNLERATGRLKYLMIYFGAGVIAGIASLSYNMLKDTNAVSVGASGAIFGVVGAMAYIVVVNKGRLENISTRQMVMFVIFSLYGGLTSQGVDNAAHIGGIIAGIALAAILYRKPKMKQY